MHRHLRLETIVAAGLLVAAVAGAAAAGQREPKGVREIRSVLKAQIDAWNRKDLEGFMSAYLRSEDLSFFSGVIRTAGWNSTLDRYRKRYQGEGREMGQLDFTDVEIEMLGPASAFVRGRWQLKMAGGDQGGLFTLIFRKINKNWKIVHDHTS